jgi:hypothetical protein
MDRKKLQEKFVGFDLKNNDNYEQVLKAIRDQVTNYLKVIFITVKEEDEAYTIFETLNARGMNLSYVDLIKNKLFKAMQSIHPDDYSKTIWKQITNNLIERENIGTFEDYMRHFWLSQYPFVTKGKIYKEFQIELNKKNIQPENFINKLKNDSKVYAIISAPLETDFMEQSEKQIYKSLLALKNFKITQHKPFILSLFQTKDNKLIRQKTLIEILVFLEKFHFIYNAVCGLPTNALERSYAKSARELNSAKDTNKVHKILDNLRKNFTIKKPSKELFKEKFLELQFLDKKTKDKKIIQYIFHTIEDHMHPTNEFSPYNMTLEHISSQSNLNKKYTGEIGNLLPLSQQLNAEAKDDNLNKKLNIYQKSQYSLTSEFSKKHMDKSSWDDNDIRERTIELSELSYNDIWDI